MFYFFVVVESGALVSDSCPDLERKTRLKLATLSLEG